MPLATPALLQLRLETGIKPGEWSVRVRASRTHYSNVERQRVVGSPELFQRCASELSQELRRPVEVADLMSSGGAPTETTEAESAAEAPVSGLA